MNPATIPKETLSKTAGAILIILGFGALLFPHLFFTLLDIFLAILAIITGIGYIISVFTSVTGFDRGLKSVSGLSLCFLGVVLLIAPALLTDYILLVILGLFAIILGILTIIFASDKPKPKKEYNHLIYK